MQSHASRHVVSEHLCDLHPDLNPPFLKEVVKDEIAVAFGRRGIEKLVAVLSLEPADLSDENRAHALRVFNGLLSHQEQKADAIHQGAAVALTRLVRESASHTVRSLSCAALSSLAQIRAGRQAVADADGMSSITEALKNTATSAADALRQYSTSLDGVAILEKVHDLVVPALVQVVAAEPGSLLSDQGQQEAEQQQELISIAACLHAASTLAGLSINDAGVEACLRHGVPKAIVKLMNRCLKGCFKLDPQAYPCIQVCCECLEQLSHHAQGKIDLREADALKALCEVLTQCAYQPDTVLAASSALMGCSVDKESKVPIAVYGGKQLTGLLMDSSDQRLVLMSRSCLVSCCEHLEARAMITALLGEGEMKTRMYKGPLPDTPPDFRYQVVLPSGASR